MLRLAGKGGGQARQQLSASRFRMLLAAEHGDVDSHTAALCAEALGQGLVSFTDSRIR